LPDYDSSVESQRKFKSLRDEGLYEPIIGGGQETDEKGEDKNGRPPQVTGVPQPNRQPGKIGEKQSKAGYSFKAIKENLVLASKLQDKVEIELKKAHKLEKLDKKQKEVANELCEIIIANETPLNWNKVRTIRRYIKSPIDTNSKAIKKIHNIAYDYQVDSYLASILYASEVKDDA
jgi:hypothetical protein